MEHCFLETELGIPSPVLKTWPCDCHQKAKNGQFGLVRDFSSHPGRRAHRAVGNSG